MRRLALSVLTVLLAASVFTTAGCGRKAGTKNTKEDTGISVMVAAARRGDITSVVEVSGNIKALKTTALSAKVMGRVTSVPYREGDRVGAGTAVVIQDTADLRAQLQQAQATLAGAQARLSQAATNAGVSDTQVESQVAQARAGLESANANLRMVKSGARTQERAQARNALASAKANYDNAKADQDRMQSLYNQGALSPKQWEAVQTQFRVAEAQYDSAKQAVSLMDAGAREEQVTAAEKQVVQASEGLKMAESNRAQKSLRQEDIKAARAGVAQAKAGLAYAQQQLANAYIRTPIGGTVATRMTEPGQMAAPGTPVMQIVALDSIYLEAQVSEMDVDKVKIGQPVDVTVDALGDRKFRGSILKILPTSDVKSRQFTIRIAVINKTGELKPGMFAHGMIQVDKHIGVVIARKDAVMQTDTTQAVYLVRDNVAKLAPVVTRFESAEEVEVVGVQPGDELVVVGQDKLSDGVKVHVAN